jgi:hypothetical protein
MSNLIITCIAIGVMALAAMMAVYYMGSTYQSSLSSATASSTLNEADQLAGMWKNFLVGNLMSPPGDWSELIQAGYLENVMEYSPGIGTQTEDHYFQIWPDDNGEHYYAIADLGDPSLADGNIACNKVLTLATGVKQADGNVPATIPDFSAATLDPVGRFSCGPLGVGPQQPSTRAVQNIGPPPVFPPITHNLLIYRLS